MLDAPLDTAEFIILVKSMQDLLVHETTKEKKKKTLEDLMLVQLHVICMFRRKLDEANALRR